jgi:MYXO-CTERM domain-containing protein
VELGIVEENVVWFADSPGGGPADGFLRVHLVVVPEGAPLDAGVSEGDGGSSGTPSPAEGGGCSASPTPNRTPWASALGLLAFALVRARRRSYTTS